MILALCLQNSSMFAFRRWVQRAHPASSPIAGSGSPAGGSERSNYQMFLTELHEPIGTGRPVAAIEDVLRSLTPLGQAELPNGGYVVSG